MICFVVFTWYGTALFPDVFLKALFNPCQTVMVGFAAPVSKEGGLVYFISNYCNLMCSIEADMSNLGATFWILTRSGTPYFGVWTFSMTGNQRWDDVKSL